MNKSQNEIPAHIAIIMDGNGRWANKRGLPRDMGHRQGAKRVAEIARHCRALGVGTLTLYAFSTENWNRPQEEIDNIMGLLRSYLNDADQYQNEDIRTIVIGDRGPLAEDLKEKIARVEEKSKDCKGLTLNIAINYGGREEITHAVKFLAQKIKDGSLSLEEIDEKLFEQGLYTANQPDPDLLIRPSGEQRLSNFLLWQCAYSELVFMDTLWPDFTTADLDAAIKTYQGRSRRFGGV